MSSKWFISTSNFSILKQNVELQFLIWTLIGIQPAGGERRKAKNRQLRESNPGSLTKAAINHWATKPPQKPASTILLSYSFHIIFDVFPASSSFLPLCIRSEVCPQAHPLVRISIINGRFCDRLWQNDAISSLAS